MKDYTELSISVRLKAYEVKLLCKLLDKFKYADDKDEDCVQLELPERKALASLFNRIKFATYVKAEKLETLGQEFKDGIDFS